MGNETPAGGGTPSFVAYEYLTVHADRDLESLYRDTLANFGWQLDGYGPVVPGARTSTIKLRRDRNIPNRALVTELQRKALESLEAISALERSKQGSAAAASLTVGVVGCAFLAGSVFTLEADHLPASILLGAAGLVCWVAGYLAHGRVAARRAAQVAPLVDGRYDALYQASEQAAHLLA